MQAWIYLPRVLPLSVRLSRSLAVFLASLHREVLRSSTTSRAAASPPPMPSAYHRPQSMVSNAASSWITGRRLNGTLEPRSKWVFILTIASDIRARTNPTISL